MSFTFRATLGTSPLSIRVTTMSTYTIREESWKCGWEVVRASIGTFWQKAPRGLVLNVMDILLYGGFLPCRAVLLVVFPYPIRLLLIICVVEGVIFMLRFGAVCARGLGRVLGGKRLRWRTVIGCVEYPYRVYQ